MKVRSEQIAALDQHQSRDYELRLTKFLQEQFADAASEPADMLLPEVAAQIQRARGYGLLSENEIANYVISAWLLGKDFDQEFPAAKQVLRAPISGNMKAHFLEQWAKQIFEELEGGK